MFRAVCKTVSVRALLTLRAAYNALVFRMPAMSPTMTEGGIVGWKYKSGDEFAAGDVLLEVETDKATIDVEAQDDGVMWEVLVEDGASGIPVGQPIALLAEVGDDLGSLLKPDLGQPASEKTEKKEVKEEKTETPAKNDKPAEKAAPPKASSKEGVSTKANPALRLTPAVEMLLHRHEIPVEKAMAEIPATGPKGRLLRGDVMAYIGEIDPSTTARIAEYIKSKEHLDLLNIKIAPPAAAKPAKDAAAAAPAEPLNKLLIMCIAKLPEDTTHDEFRFDFERALATATQLAYASRFEQYEWSPLAMPETRTSPDEIFDDLLVAPVTKDRFVISDLLFELPRTVSAKPAAAPVDAFDDLLGLAPQAPPAAPEVPEINDRAYARFIITYDEKLSDAMDFVQRFNSSLQLAAKCEVFYDEID